MQWGLTLTRGQPAERSDRFTECARIDLNKVRGGRVIGPWGSDSLAAVRGLQAPADPSQIAVERTVVGSAGKGWPSCRKGVHLNSWKGTQGRASLPYAGELMLVGERVGIEAPDPFVTGVNFRGCEIR